VQTEVRPARPRVREEREQRLHAVVLPVRRRQVPDVRSLPGADFMNLCFGPKKILCDTFGQMPLIFN
jgi:hypothetical protein